jgi:hypothetical protein
LVSGYIAFLLSRIFPVATVVYAKAPFGAPAQILAYLARYTHRAAISNSRHVVVDDDEVAFIYKDYRRDDQSKVMRLHPHEFMPFLLHVLPDGFHRISHYGLPIEEKSSNAAAPSFPRKRPAKILRRQLKRRSRRNLLATAATSPAQIAAA